MLTLDISTIGSNSRKKASLENYGLDGNACLTQEFSSVQSDTFDVYIDKIETNFDSGSNHYYNRTGYTFTGWSGDFSDNNSPEKLTIDNVEKVIK